MWCASSSTAGARDDCQNAVKQVGAAIGYTIDALVTDGEMVAAAVPMSSCNDSSRKTAGIPLGAVGRGLAAGAVGTLAMDLLLYARCRRGGGKQHLFAWEFSSGLSS